MIRLHTESALLVLNKYKDFNDTLCTLFDLFFSCTWWRMDEIFECEIQWKNNSKYNDQCSVQNKTTFSKINLKLISNA